MRFSTVLAMVAALAVQGCMSARQHREAVTDTPGTALTVGTVQKEIRVGMSGAEVAAVPGVPQHRHDR